MKKPTLLSFFAAFLASSSSASGELVPPKLRLDDGARPLRYSVDLTILPEKQTFEGKIDIEGEFARSQTLFWLHANELTIHKAHLEIEGKDLQVEVLPTEENFIAIRWKQPFGPGVGKLHLEYTGLISSTDYTGVFKQKDGAEWYVYSHFEAT